MIEIVVGADGGTSFRVYAAGAVVPPTPPAESTQREVMSAAEWDAEIAKLEAKKRSKKHRTDEE